MRKQRTITLRDRLDQVAHICQCDDYCECDLQIDLDDLIIILREFGIDLSMMKELTSPLRVITKPK